MRDTLYFLPRGLSLLIVSFFTAFILEGFTPGFTWIDALMHALVAMAVGAITVVAWKRPKIGGWFFILLGLGFLLLMFPPEDMTAGMLFGGTPVITGVLFLIQGHKGR